MRKNYLTRILDFQQGSSEWLEFRKWKIGSSLAPSIMGVGFKTPLQLFEDIMEDKQDFVNPAMKRGTDLEPVVRSLLNEKYKCNLQSVVIIHPKYSWHYSSTDGVCEREDGSLFGVEIKCPGKVDHQTAKEGKVPEKYLPQLYHILEDIPEMDKILYVSYHADSCEEIWVHRDVKRMAKQLDMEIDFYNRLFSCRPPEPSEKDWVSINDLELLEKTDELKHLNSQITDLSDRASKLKEDIISSLNGQNRVKIGETRVQKVIRQGAIEYSKIEALKGLDLNPYRKDPIISWRITN